MSIRINLLPYREQKRGEARRQFTVLAAGVLGLAAAVVVLSHGIVAGYISVQETRNAFVTEENVKLDKKIDEIKGLQSEIEALKARKGVIETLQFERASAVQIMDQMVRLTPEGIYLKSLKQTGSTVNVTGYAMSNDLVSDYMIAVTGSKYLENPVLVEIKAAKEGERRVAEFSLNFSMAKPKEVDAAAAAGKPGSGKAATAARAAASATPVALPATAVVAPAAAVQR